MRLVLACSFCGGQADVIDLDVPDDFDTTSLGPVICFKCMGMNDDNTGDYFRKCPWCNTLISLGPLNKLLQGECASCKQPIEAALVDGKPEVQKLFGGPRATKVEGDAEWDV